MKIVDAQGTLHRRCDDRTKVRIVSLVPSVTELLCDLGLAQGIVGRSCWCIHPADEVATIPQVGGLKTVDVERIRQLAPTHLVVDIDESDGATVNRLEPLVPHVIAIGPRAPRDNLALYRLFGHVFACEREAGRLTARFEAAWHALEQATAASKRPSERVLYLTGKDPWTTVAPDSYIARTLATIGWMQVDVAHAIAPDAPSSPRCPVIDVVAAAAGVDRILLANEPYLFTESHVAMLAARASRVQIVDGERLSWYGSRAIAGLDYLGSLAVGV
jgi:Periplasmic binding protein